VKHDGEQEIQRRIDLPRMPRYARRWRYIMLWSCVSTQDITNDAKLHQLWVSKAGCIMCVRTIRTRCI